MKKLTLFTLITGFLLSPFQAAAATFDGKTPLLCAVIEASECGAGVGCHDTTVEIMNIPRFMKVDFKKKKISAADASGDTRVTQITNSSSTNGNLVMQGKSDNGRGWTMNISEETGDMTATAAGDQFGFFLFGACTLAP